MWAIQALQILAASFGAGQAISHLRSLTQSGLRLRDQPSQEALSATLSMSAPAQRV